MSMIKVELHTSVELQVGAVLTGEIKILESLDGQNDGKSLAVMAQVGRRIRPIGYINSMPQYVTVVADQVIAAMEIYNLNKIELEVVKKEDQQIDERNIYILKIVDIDVATSILEKSLNVENLSDKLLTVEESNKEKADSSESKENKTLNTAELVQRAIDELSVKCAKVVEDNDEASINTNTVTTVVKRLAVGGASRVNPSKLQVIQLIKDGDMPFITLQKGENDSVNVMFEGKAAGELEFTESEDIIDVSKVESVIVDGVKPFGYYVNITLKYSKDEMTGENTEANMDEESLFVELMKPILEELSISNSDLNAEDIAKNDNIVNQVWALVNKVKGKDVCEEVTSGENIKNTSVETIISQSGVERVQTAVKKSKKITRDGIRKIMSYLAVNDIPSKYINKIVSSYKEYPEEYLERIPSFEDKGFTPWKYTGKGPNLLKLAIISIEKGKNLRLVGGKGAGKNTLLSTLACVYQRPLFSQSANRDTDITHLFGDKTIDVIEVEGQISQRVEFEKGLLVEAMEIGGFYEFGEGNACRPEVTMALHSVLDSRREADVNGYKLVKAHEDFSFVLTMNVDYEGCNSLNQAFRDRFTTISFPSPTSISNILKEACPNAAAKDIRTCDKLYSDILTRVDELQTDEVITIRGYINALDLAEDLSLKEALQMCVAHNVSDDESIVQEILEIIDSVVA